VAANKYKVFVRAISTDGTSLFLDVEVFNGLHTLPTIHPSFSVDTPASDIVTYLQNIAVNQPALDPLLKVLVGNFVYPDGSIGH
jgi:hypothetical protein